MPSSFETVNGARLAVEDTGAGDDVVVLLHAGVADRAMWTPQVQALAPRFRVIAYDLRGFGESTLPDEPYSHVDDLAALLEARGVDRAHLVGVSFASGVATAFAAAHPPRVRSLVLVGGTYGRYDFDAETERLDAATDAAIERGDLDAATESDVRLWVVGPYREPAAVDAAFMDRARPLVAAAAARAAERNAVESRDRPAWDALPALRVPVLFVVGLADVPNLVEAAREAAERVPDGRLVEIPDAAHLPNLERPSRFNEALASFLKRAGENGKGP